MKGKKKVKKSYTFSPEVITALEKESKKTRLSVSHIVNEILIEKLNVKV